MKRSAELRRTPMARTTVKPKPAPQPKEGACAWCSKPFLKLRPLQNVCRPLCAMRKARADREAKVKAEKAQTRERRLALKRIPDLIREAQTAFNAFIRERDRDKPCICCGHPLGANEVGGSFDCGHYRSTGSAPHLRFDERNAHGQRKHCNRYGAGRAVDYRRGLIERLGAAEVEALECDNRPRQWDRAELIALKATYVGKRKELVEQREGRE